MAFRFNSIPGCVMNVFVPMIR